MFRPLQLRWWEVANLLGGATAIVRRSVELHGWESGYTAWVREPFYIDDERLKGKLPSRKPEWIDSDAIYYRANGTCCQQIPECQCETVGKPRWKPSIQMPQWASRLTLDVSSAQTMNVQSVSDADAISVGVKLWGDFLGRPEAKAALLFRSYWTQYHKQKSWEDNDMVCILTFSGMRITNV